MTKIIERSAAPARSETPTDRVLTATLVVGPVLYLAADTIYALNGWADATAAAALAPSALAQELPKRKSGLWEIRMESGAGKGGGGGHLMTQCVDQSRDDLNPNHNVWEAITDALDVVVLGDAEVNSRAYCSSFNFKGADQQKKVGLLSGGERNRVHMAKLLRSGGNVLLLDEPTNDLDVETLQALEAALDDFAGCAVIISHDRMFLDRMATHILAFEGDSHVEWFEGNFEDYEKDKVRRLGPESINPHRMAHKRLTR